MALMGSGEFEPWAEAVDRWLFERARKADGTVLIVPAASAPEGDEAYSMWSVKGLGYYQRLGMTAEVLPIKSRDDTSNETLIARLREASMVFFSGGNPSYLARMLEGTLFWQALQEEIERGLAYGGCSAGACFLGTVAPDSAREGLVPELWTPGLCYFADADIGPHWDKLDEYVPGLRDYYIEATKDARLLIAVDESTAVVGDGRSWVVSGLGKAHTRLGSDWRDYAAGEAFQAPVLAST